MICLLYLKIVLICFKEHLKVGCHLSSVYYIQRGVLYYQECWDDLKGESIMRSSCLRSQVPVCLTQKSSANSKLI